MRIVVSHLTRMNPGYICVAGLDLDSGAHIRPVLNSTRLATAMLRRCGGIFDIGSVIDLGTTSYQGRRPETEDHLFSFKQARHAGMVPAPAFWQLLRQTSQARLTDIFGPDLKRIDHTCAVDPGMGKASLGCLAAERPVLRVDKYNKIRIGVTTNPALPPLDLPVTDIRLYETDQRTPRYEVIEDVAARIGEGTSVLLGVGLTRAYAKLGDQPAQHWLQVNNLHLADDPLFTDRER
jgi:hypothetical protein